MPKVFYQGSDSVLLAGANNFSTLISAAPLPLGLTPALATAYATLNTAYASAYSTAANPPTRTSVTIAAKDTARALLVNNTIMLAALVLRMPRGRRWWPTPGCWRTSCTRRRA